MHSYLHERVGKLPVCVESFASVVREAHLLYVCARLVEERLDQVPAHPRLLIVAKSVR